MQYYYEYDTYEYGEFNYETLRIILVVAHSLNFALGTVGNGVVIFITGFRMKKTVNHVWFLSLAIADFPFSFFLIFNIVPAILKFHWPLGHVMSKLSHTVVFFKLFASLYLLLAISIDRCISAWCPVWAQNHRTPRLASFVVLGVWILALGLCSPNFFFKETSYNDESNPKERSNGYGKPYKDADSTFYVMPVIQLLFGFVIPFSVIVVCCGVVRLWRDHLYQASKPSKVITAVIMAFFVCWYPFYFFSLLTAKSFEEPGVPWVFHIGFLLSSCLAYFNSCLNPILYFCMGHNFKEKPKCSFLSAFETAFTEESNQSHTKFKTKSSAELESRDL